MQSSGQCSLERRRKLGTQTARARDQASGTSSTIDYRILDSGSLMHSFREVRNHATSRDRQQRAEPILPQRICGDIQQLLSRGDSDKVRRSLMPVYHQPSIVLLAYDGLISLIWNSSCSRKQTEQDASSSMHIPKPEPAAIVG